MYLEAKFQDPKKPEAVIVKWFTVKGWMRTCNAIVEDVPVKEWKQKAAVIKAARKELANNPHYQITVKK